MISVSATTKVCHTCKKRLSVGNFYADKKTRDGLGSNCRKCLKEYGHRRYLSKKPRTIKLESPHSEYKQAEKEAARLAVATAVKLGVLEAVRLKKCVMCGTQAAHYHHWSYAEEDWLNVTPLCAACHSHHHAQYRKSV